MSRTGIPTTTIISYFQGSDAFVAKIEGYRKNIELWSDNLAKIRSHFIFKQDIIDSVDSFLRKLASTFHSDRDKKQVIFEQINSVPNFEGELRDQNFPL